jgi:hypothetical protein
MICGTEFGFFTHRHHCRCCGNVVCHDCSPENVEIYEMKKLGPQRVCVQCYWGQVSVSKADNAVYIFTNIIYIHIYICPKLLHPSIRFNNY